MRLATSTIVLAIILALWVMAEDMPPVAVHVPTPAPTAEPELTIEDVQDLARRARESSEWKKRAATAYRAAAESAVRQVEIERDQPNGGD